VSGWYLPTGHGVAAIAPEPETNDPAGAARQWSWPELGWYVPGEHDVGLIFPRPKANLPGGASMQWF
jgi:hypothetical protein